MHIDIRLNFSFPVTQKLAYVRLYKCNSDINKLHTDGTRIPSAVRGWIIFLLGSDLRSVMHDLPPSLTLKKLSIVSTEWMYSMCLV